MNKYNRKAEETDKGLEWKDKKGVKEVEL